MNSPFSPTTVALAQQRHSQSPSFISAAILIRSNKHQIQTHEVHEEQSLIFAKYLAIFGLGVLVLCTLLTVGVNGMFAVEDTDLLAGIFVAGISSLSFSAVGALVAAWHHNRAEKLTRANTLISRSIGLKS